MIRIRFNDDDRVESLTGTNVIDYNRYFRAGATAFYENRQTTDLSFAQWKAATGFDAHSREGDPGLDAQFHLLPGSPCLRAGLPSSLVTSDFDGNPRTGNPDLGADQSGGTPLAVPPPGNVVGTGLK